MLLLKELTSKCDIKTAKSCNQSKDKTLVALEHGGGRKKLLSLLVIQNQFCGSDYIGGIFVSLWCSDFAELLLEDKCHMGESLIFADMDPTQFRDMSNSFVTLSLVLLLWS